MRGTAIIGLLLAIAVTVGLFGGAWLIVQIVSTGQSAAALRWVALAAVAGLLIYRLYVRIRRNRAAGDA